MYIKVQETVGVEGNVKDIRRRVQFLCHQFSRIPRVFWFVGEVERGQ